MAAPGGAEATWNRLVVPWPACSAAVAVPAQHVAVSYFSAVKKGCRHAANALTKKAVIAEQSLLHSILYSFRYQMSRHRPYQSLKQVEQCLKRLNLMNLEKPIQDLINLDSRNQESENPAESLIPSQPVIEVVLVKILGSCKLVLRLLECCCTSFLLSVKHLHLEEYILLNTLVLGLLSRLWILFRGLLKTLSSLYKSLLELLQEVSEIQPRPYIKGFAFPSDINEFLGTPASEIKKKMPRGFVIKQAGSGWMNRLFTVRKTAPQSLALTAAAPARVRKKMRSSQNTLDIGTPILVKRTNQVLGKELKFDIKALCKYPNSALQNVKFRVEFPESKRRSTSPKSLRCQQLKPFVPKFQEASSFEELTDTLKTTILWCKTNKLGSEAFFLGMKLLKSRRLQHVEAQGCRLRRKLGCMKATLCKYLTLSNCIRRPNKMLRAYWCLRKHHKLLKQPRCVSKRTPTNTPVFAKGQWSNSLPQVLTDVTGSRTETTEEQDLVAVERNSTHIQRNKAENKDDIDDIFKIKGL
ncbi:nucleolus and neural progenitor protein isoform X2 [Pogona vitticeps]